MQLHFLAKAQLQLDTLKLQGEREPQSLCSGGSPTLRTYLVGGGRGTKQCSRTPGPLQVTYSDIQCICK